MLLYYLVDQESSSPMVNHEIVNWPQHMSFKK